MNETNFESVCAPYSAMVYRHCFQMLKTREEAEDAAQETMIRAFRAFSRYRGKGVATWLFQIAHNICLDVLKSSRMKHGRYTETIDETTTIKDKELNPEERYVKSSEAERLSQAVQTLSIEEQTLLSLYYSQGLSYSELSEALGLNEGTVKSRLNRAKGKLRKRLSKDDDYSE